MPIVLHTKPFSRDDRCLADIFESLMRMEDANVLRVLAYVMAETLEAHSGTVEALGALLSTDMRNWWKPDETFFALMRDKAAINAMVREVAGDMTADAHTASIAKVQKGIIGDCLTGDNGRDKVEGWLPRYMAFPASGYTEHFEGYAQSGEDEHGESDDYADAA